MRVLVTGGARLHRPPSRPAACWRVGDEVGVIDDLLDRLPGTARARARPDHPASRAASSIRRRSTWPRPAATSSSTRRPSRPSRPVARSPQATNAVNVDGTIEVMLAAARNGVRAGRLAGSSSIYGVPESLPVPRDVSTRAAVPLRREQARRASTTCSTLGKLHGIETVIAALLQRVRARARTPRPSTPRSCRSSSPRRSQGERPTINGGGDVSRDFTYVDNVVEANMLAARVAVRAASPATSPAATPYTCSSSSRRSRRPVGQQIPSSGRPGPATSCTRRRTSRAPTRRSATVPRAVRRRDRPHRRVVPRPYRRSVTEGIPAGLPDGSSPQARGVSLASVARSAVILTGATVCGPGPGYRARALPCCPGRDLG